MTRKQLPKAIRPTSLNLAQAVIGAVADDRVAASRPALAHESFEPEPALEVISAAPANDTLASSTMSNSQRLTARRHAIAGRIVEAHGTYAALSGLAPLPAVNIAGVAAIIMRMLKQLSGLYQVHFEPDGTRSFVISILGAAAPTGLGLAAVSTIGLVVPAPAFLGLAVSALSAGAVTRAIGEVFIESFERQAPLG